VSVGEAQAYSLRGQGGKHNLYEKTFVVLLLVAVLIGVASLITLLIDVLRVGAPRLSVDFLTSLPSRFAARAGAQPALWGTLWVISVCTLFSVPVGMGAAIYLEEFARKGRLATLIELNIANLAAVPSIIYGLLGLAVFVRFFAMGRSVLAGGLTLGLLVLPVIVLSGREALRAVPSSIRDGALALGATRWQTVSRQVYSR
jgi:phosphate transport system permease protein